MDKYIYILQEFISHIRFKGKEVIKAGTDIHDR